MSVISNNKSNSQKSSWCLLEGRKKRSAEENNLRGEKKKGRQKKIKKGNVCEEKFCGKTDYILDLICVFKMAKHAITPFSLRRVALKQFSQLVHPV